MRHALFLPLLLAACHQAPAASVDQPAPAAVEASLPTIPCTVDDKAVRCTVERVQAPGGLVLVLHHPDGGFRRLLVTDDGRGVIAADGAEPASVVLAGHGTIEVTLGGDRYRLPATIGGNGGSGGG